ncbi:uncharacterized monothiol glutaredoxin ycf64-like [Centruroides vittatus]|uniref:uncharacterized monothiol glutaredoxin ycf64-like n=1 Tax=Centruroides vittatus TaxID=120091 RepID=UPI0035109813
MLSLGRLLDASCRGIFRRNLLYRFATISTEVEADIRAKIGGSKVVVFMKGCPDKPMCGFSNAVVQILRMHNVRYDSYDVLRDETLRQGIKDFSNWPTIPQVYINGEFVGGCDILLQMHQNGELIDELQKAGITSAILSREAEQMDDSNGDKVKK